MAENAVCISARIKKNDSVDSSVLTTDRRKRIQRLVRSIAGQKRKHKIIEKDKQMEVPKKKRRGNGRHPTLKLQIGWIHETRGRYRQVTARRGGGTRIYEFDREEKQTVETITSYGKRVFFPDGKNDMGKLTDMEIKLSSYNGEVVEKFANSNGEECSYQEYLKDIGAYASQYYLYIRTSLKAPSSEPSEDSPCERPEESFSEESFPDLCLLSLKVNGETPGKICVCYTKTCYSSYTEELSQKTCFTVHDCYQDSNMFDPETERNGYNPLEHGFKVTGFIVNDITVLSQLNTNKFEYPTANDSNGIIHTPDQIMGFERSNPNQILLGILYKPHNSGALFRWKRNDEYIASGVDLCIIPVTEPGKYSVTVSDEEASYECGYVSVEVEGLQPETFSAQQTAQVIQTETSSGRLNAEDLQTATFSAEPTAQGILTELPMGWLKAQGLQTATSSGGLSAPGLLPETTSGVQIVRTETSSGGLTAQSLQKETSCGGPTNQSLQKGTYCGGLTDQDLQKETSSDGLTAQGLKEETSSGGLKAIDLQTKTSSGRLTAHGLLTETSSGGLAAQSLQTKTSSGGLTAQSLLTETSSGGLAAQGLLTGPFSGGLTAPGLQSKSSSGLTVQGLQTKTSSGGLTAQDLHTKSSSGGPTAHGLLTETTSGGPTAQSLLTETSSGLTAQCLQTKSSSGELTVQGLLTEPFSGGLTVPGLQAKYSGLTVQGLQTKSSSGGTTAQSLQAKSASDGLTDQGLQSKTSSGGLTAQGLQTKTSSGEFTAQGLQSESSSGGLISQGLQTKTSSGGLTAQGLQTQNSSGGLTAQGLQTQTSSDGLKAQGLQTQTSGGGLTAQDLQTQTSSGGLTAQGLQTENACASSSRAYRINLSTDSNVPEIAFESLQMGLKIGEGSFGTVQKALWLSTPVAVKTVRIRRMKVVQKALAREVRVLSRVRHPNIILFMAYSINNNALHIVSEYIQGSNLDDLLFGNQCQQIPLPKKCHIAGKISQAVAYLHNSCPMILHRDIKPENIIVTDNLDTVKLCDLGISKLLTINTSATTYAEGMQPGTPIFQAPEILLGNEPASTKSDVWGMAGTFAELFSETPMWDLQEEDEEVENSSVETVKKMMHQKEAPHAIQRLSHIDYIPRTVIDIVMQGLDYDPDRRPQSIEFPTKFSI